MDLQYETGANLAKRQRLWATARREPAAFDLIEWVLDLCELRGDERILDVGCGNGAYEAGLRRRGHRGTVVALDLSPGMRPGVVGDAQALPFGSDAFDVVLAPHMLYHVPDIPAAAAEARRVLRDGGAFVAVTNSERQLVELRGLVEDAVGSGWRMLQPATATFSTENGRAPLASAFDSVELVQGPAGHLVVEDVEAIADYVASVPEYALECGVAWDGVVARVRETAEASIAAEGALRFTASGGAFVCR